MRSSNQGISLTGHQAFPLDDFGSHQIDQFDVAILPDHEILGLEVSVYDSLTEKILQDQDHGGHVELGILSGEYAYLSYS